MKFALRSVMVLLALILTLSSLASCNVGSDPKDEPSELTTDDNTPDSTTVPDETTVDDTPVQKNGDLTLMKDKESLFTIIRPEYIQDQAEAALAFNKAVSALTGTLLKIGTDYVNRGEAVDNSKYEILIGSTNRDASKELEEKIGNDQFAIKTTDTKLVIVAGNASLLKDAVQYFIENYLVAGKAEISDEGCLKLITEIDYVSEPSQKLKDILLSSDSFASICDAMFTVALPSDTSFKTLQGGCIYGNRCYMIFIRRDYDNNEKNNRSRIIVSEFPSGKKLKESGDLALNHSNDVTYNPKTNQLIVCHNNPNRNLISILDADTLEIVRTVTLPVTIYSIDYNEARDKYVIGISGGQTFRFLDSSFNLDSAKVCRPTSLTTGYTTQGICCDDNFIYHVLYKNNVITVYDWDGQFISLITLSVGSIEPENISIVNDEIYIGCASGGAKIFKVTPTNEKKEITGFTSVSKTMYVTASSLNVRSTPDSSVDNNKLGLVSNGAAVKVTGINEEIGWSRIEYNGAEAYVSSKYLSDTAPDQTTAQ